MDSKNDSIDLVRAALGLDPCDLAIKNICLLNVFSGSMKVSTIGIKHGRVVSINSPEDIESSEVFDGEGLYAIPGFIDSHIHIDSTLLTPVNLANLIVPFGTTTVLADPMEIANVAGLRGIEALLGNIQHLPFHIFLEIPSRVPSAPGLETTGGCIGLDDVRSMLEWDLTVSLGELDPSKVLGLQKEYFAKVSSAHSHRMIVNGHAAGLKGRDLAAYACVGIADDHECLHFEELLDRIELGMAVMVREGSTERNLDELIQGVVHNSLDTRFLMMCSDDKHPDDIIKEGHIDYMVNRAISLGLLPLQAIQMATLNPATHFRIDDTLGCIAPGRWADIILTKDIYEIQPEYVFVAGNLVAKDGHLTNPLPPSEYPEWLRNTIRVTSGTRPQDFYIKRNGSTCLVHVIEVSEDQIVNRQSCAELPVIGQRVKADIEQDVLRIAVVERYDKNGNIGQAFIRGFGMKEGAISSSIAHDHHNIVIVGVDEESMATCVRATMEMQGGFVIAQKNEVLHQLPLPLGGLLSDQSAVQVGRHLEQLNKCVKTMGCKLASPFMTLSFVSLPTVPDLGLTDMGLIDVRSHKIISAFKD